MNKEKGRYEAELYEPIRDYLCNFFKENFSLECYLEITANGSFSETIKEAVRSDIIFHFLHKKASPDLTGYVWDKDTLFKHPFSTNITKSVKDLITVEIKKDKLSIQDIYQSKMYGDLFQARYALLISPERIPEELKRLDTKLLITKRYMSGWKVYLGEWVRGRISWYPEDPLPASYIKI